MRKLFGPACAVALWVTAALSSAHATPAAFGVRMAVEPAGAGQSQVQHVHRRYYRRHYYPRRRYYRPYYYPRYAYRPYYYPRYYYRPYGYPYGYYYPYYRRPGFYLYFGY